MAVVIRMKQMGRKHRPYFRICATDSRAPRDGKFLEEIGTYDPMVPDTDARCTLNQERITYWLGVGAKPSEKVSVLIKKYGPKGTRLSEQATARERLAMPKIVPPAGEAVFVYVPKSNLPAEAPVETPMETATETASPEAATEASAPAAGAES